MRPQEKVELAELLEETMLRRERWPKIKFFSETKFINGIPVMSMEITLPSSVHER